jgi:hypothetical protein
MHQKPEPKKGMEGNKIDASSRRKNSERKGTKAGLL